MTKSHRPSTVLTCAILLVACGDDTSSPPAVSSVGESDSSDGGDSTGGASDGEMTSGAQRPTGGDSADESSSDAGSDGSPSTTVGLDSGPDGSDSVGESGLGEDDSSGDGGGTTTADSTGVTSTTTDTSGSSADGGSDGSSDDGSVVGDGFAPVETFGDDARELDLVGTWGLNWDPASGFDSVLTIGSDGTFLWQETTADCSVTYDASGEVWVDGAHIVMHFYEWQGPKPWDTMQVMGETYSTFRVWSHFAIFGGDHLVLSGPPGMTRSAPYEGEQYIRMTQDGLYLGGHWYGQSIMWAIPTGSDAAEVIVVEGNHAYLDAELGPPPNPDGYGYRAYERQFFPIADYDVWWGGGNWTCYDDCDQAAGGDLLLHGDNVYVYDDYAGTQRMATMSSGRAFRRDVGSDCL